MSEDNTAIPAADKKRAVSKRIVLDFEGKEQDDWIDAYGFEYTSLAENYTARVMFSDYDDSVVRALAAFGGLTLAGNTTNTVRNDPNKTGGSEKEALVAWLENLKAGNWTSPRGEVEAGLGLLAEAYAAAMTKEGNELSSEVALEKLKAADKEKRATVRKHPQVRAELTRIMADRAAAKAKAAEPIALPTL